MMVTSAQDRMSYPMVSFQFSNWLTAESVIFSPVLPYFEI